MIAAESDGMCCACNEMTASRCWWHSRIPAALVSVLVAHDGAGGTGQRERAAGEAAWRHIAELAHQARVQNKEEEKDE